MLRASRKSAASGERSLRPAVADDDDNSYNSSKNRITGRPLAIRSLIMLLIIISVAASAVVISKKFSSYKKNSKSKEVSTSSLPLRKVEKKEKDNERNFHIVFSTDCNPFQHWQSFLLYHSALKVNQAGKVTRIASGCEDGDREKLIEWHKKHVTPMSPPDEPNKFTLHLTPHFSAVKDESGKVVGDYEFFNKPFGLLHFLQHYDDTADQYGISSKAAMEHQASASLKLNPNDIVILLDPDMVLLRPFTQDFTPSSTYQPKFARRKTPPYTKVTHGQPFAQEYGFGSSWADLNLTRITGSSSSPALKVSNEAARLDYPVGPPYVGTANDMFKIAQKWVEFVPRTHKEHPHLLAEMFAYCIAAAHLQLPHVSIASMMVSDQEVREEGWDMLDNVAKEDLCEFGASATSLVGDTLSKMNEMKTNKDQLKTVAQIPNVLHLCQRYMVGEYFFGKRKLPYDYFSCESPILATPPANLGGMYDYRVRPGESRDQHIPLDPSTLKRSVFMICSATKALQDAAVYFKTQHCTGDEEGSHTNWKKELNLFELFYK